MVTPEIAEQLDARVEAVAIEVTVTKFKQHYVHVEHNGGVFIQHVDEFWSMFGKDTWMQLQKEFAERPLAEAKMRLWVEVV